jgi:hypothetical protein
MHEPLHESLGPNRRPQIGALSPHQIHYLVARIPLLIGRHAGRSEELAKSGNVGIYLSVRSRLEHALQPLWCVPLKSCDR